MSELKIYEVKIGYARQAVNQRSPREDHPVRTEYIQAKSLKAAKLIATNKLKDCLDMKSFVTRKNGEPKSWLNWTKAKFHKGEFHSHKKSELSREGDYELFGWVQLSWDESQLTFNFKE